jgi:ParB family chromosome partitioning protein
LRRLVGETAKLTEEEAASFDALRTEYETLEAEHAGGDDSPEAIDQRLGEIETAMAAFENRPIRFDPADIARAGIFVSIDSDGALRVERGFVRPEDEAPVAPVPTEADDTPEPTSTEIPVQRAVITIGGAPSASEPEASEEDDTIRPLSDRLVTELTAYRTLALRDGVANDPQVAFQAVLHALCLNAFYRYAASTCLEITAKQSGFSAQAPGLAETASAKAIDARHAQWAKQLPETPADLWDTLTAFDSDSQSALFAHCASLTVNVVKEPWNRRPDAFCPWRSTRPGRQSRHGRRGLEADRR